MCSKVIAFLLSSIICLSFGLNAAEIDKVSDHTEQLRSEGVSIEQNVKGEIVQSFLKYECDHCEDCNDCCTDGEGDCCKGLCSCTIGFYFVHLPQIRFQKKISFLDVRWFYLNLYHSPHLDSNKMPPRSSLS